MKKTIFGRPTFLASTLLALGAGLFVSINTLAEEEPMDKMTQLEAQVNELLAFKQQVQNYNPNISPFDDFKNIDPGTQQAGGDGTKFPPTLDCSDDHLEWFSSDTYKESDWAMEDLPMLVGGQLTSQYNDINGDGLVDHFFLYSNGGERRSCVQLNNGRGWDLVHKCYAKMNVNTKIWTFYGDCAK